ncbi:hypothetical protein HF325_003722 [Metschnikowia pulcherrima]|uniref:Chromatin structure-remodeling complex protein RSC58 n=1 Tax=Metschnikowia pulcherrima TaxID=27326 RepID=A0A8H7GRM4_9ASCO|nr:hypothetical protein HF325_003722 [Metschnikowia pulcherrima]
MHDKAFESLLNDLAPVYASADTHGLLTKDVVPELFHEANPEAIVRAYEKYMVANSEPKTVSVASRIEANSYHKPYALYHDLKVACGAEIVKHEVGSNAYREIDEFFRFCTDLLLREVAALGQKLFDAKEREEDEILDTFRDDFTKISLTHMTANGEFVTFIHKYTEPAVPAFHGAFNSLSETETKPIVQPLFSGLVGRSVLDPRNTVVPEPWLVAKAIGAGSTSLNSNTIKSFNTVACKIPLPAQASAQVLDNFFHPNWYTIEAPKWLQYKQKTLKPALNSTLVKNCDANELRVFEKKSNATSLAPVIDLRNSVLSEELKLKIWYSNIGRKQVESIKKLPAADVAAEANSDIELDDDIVSEKGADEESNKMDIDTETQKPAENAEIKLVNLVKFDPEALASLEALRKEKSRIVKSPREIQKVISLNLLKLNKLRQERYLHSTSPGTPSSAETSLYKRVVKLLALLAGSNAARDKILGLQLSKKIPILINDYQGVLPGPIPAKPLSTTKSSRLAGIKGAYKKKSRFL